MLMLGLFAIAKRQHAIANDPFAYNPVGFGKVWDPGWESPAWPNVDCYEEMYNTNMSCMTVLQCFKRHGIGLLLNDTMQQLPFWYSQPLGHRWSQNAAGAAAALGVEENQKVLNFLTSHYHESYVGTYVDTTNGQVSPGTMHGGVWYTAGTQPAYGYHNGYANPWPTIEKLCPMIDPETITRGGKSTLSSLFEYIVVGCLHGLGHAGFVAATHAKSGYTPCDNPGSVLTPTVMQASTMCERAPSTTMKYYCYAGFYHALFEHHNHVDDGTSWMWPCDAGIFPYPELCFFFMNIVIGQTYCTKLPFALQLVLPNTTDTHRRWMQRTTALDTASPGNPAGVCGSVKNEEVVLACIDGYAALTACYGPFCYYFRQRFKQLQPGYGIDLIDLCTTLVVPPGTPSVESFWNSTMERRWLACVSGSARHEAETKDCEPLLTVQGQPEAMRIRAFNLCQLTYDDSYSIAHVGSPYSKRRTVQWDWEWWKNADLRNVDPSNNWKGAGPGYSFLEPYSDSPLGKVPFRGEGL